MLNIDIIDIISKGLLSDNRPEDELLHCSSDIIGSLRHAQLRILGAKRLDSPLVSSVTLETGTMWHKRVIDFYQKARIQFQYEIPVDDGLPLLWSGTADWLIWDSEKSGFILGDLKTTRGEGLIHIKKKGAKEEHLWQLSAYWHALVLLGFPMVKGFFILYLPTNTSMLPGKQAVYPIICECEPFSKDAVWDRLIYRADAIRDLHKAYEKREIGDYIDLLAPETPREQKLVYDKAKKQWDLKLTPHWTTKFCPYPDELCACNSQGETKIGSYILDDNLEYEYHSRAGYEEFIPIIAPEKEF